MNRQEQASGTGAMHNKRLVELLRQVAAQDDKHAFEQLYHHFAPRLHGYMIGAGMASDLAEDLVQETLAEVWRKAALYRPELSGVATWVFTIGRNLRIDRFRKMRRFEMRATPQADTEPSEPFDYVRKLDALDLYERMKRLPGEQFQVLRLSYIEGLSQSEISERLSLPLGTVKSRIRLAFSSIRKELSPS